MTHRRGIMGGEVEVGSGGSTLSEAKAGKDGMKNS